MCGAGDNEVVRCQQSLIEQFRKLTGVLNDKCNVIQSTQLSKDEKFHTVSQVLNPQVAHIATEIQYLEETLESLLKTDCSTVVNETVDNESEFQFNMHEEGAGEYGEPEIESKIPKQDSHGISGAELSDSGDDNVEIIGSSSLQQIVLSDEDQDDVEILEDFEEDLQELDGNEDLLQVAAWNRVDNDEIELPPILNDAPLPTLPDREEEQTQPTYRWTDELYYHLQATFKLKGFRPNQLTAINSVLSGKDVFVLMPTGGGKSLCYQLPALVKSGETRGTTVVISPLISLMQDQVEHLLDLNIRACMFNSKNSAAQRNEVFNLLINGDLDLIYMSPEMIKASAQCQRALGTLYKNRQLARIVIDEAHCVSNWGHDFRPDYKQLSYFKMQYPEIPVIALTATANKQVQSDIINNLRLKSAVQLRQSFNRDNLFYQSIPKNNKTSIPLIVNSLKTVFRGQSGIIYCHSKIACEKLTALLKKEGINCRFYHAGMDTTDRELVQRGWQANQIQVIIATIAFGMGIDKSDVRFVFHYTVPRTLENYYQETGRAGRDGKFSYCITFYSFADIRTLQKMIQRDRKLDKSNKLKQLENLQQVMNFCDNMIDCRRKLILSYFNESFDVKDCNNNCDNCAKQHFKSETDGSNTNVEDEEKDITDIALRIVELVRSIQDEVVTTSYCQDVFKGSNMLKIVQANHHMLPEHGTGKSLRKVDIEKIFFHLITLRILQEYSKTNGLGFVSNYVKVGPNVRDLKTPDCSIKLRFFKETKKRVPLQNGSPSESTASADDNLPFIKVLNKRRLSMLTEPVRAIAHTPTSPRWASNKSNFRVDERELQYRIKVVDAIRDGHLTNIIEDDSATALSPGGNKKRKSFKRKRSKGYRRKSVKRG
ncbi:RecQ family ATP-dependent DNA helicase KNAG_0D00680 [Huiozyma naganishii CBS 8797]|uniref:ATP-dependent DNA helicase n=1 Tax=Huiozyma naganishii (strain ATCC MYA-139 / BCRC 22969 / CBS 8797 / KCTC 17520 / NBRC 10181 / NCYC 3082 / Yp74L-3) TaxID=1071383 RepID=J7R4P9_HUIN7|nr:hypothetical protein KNAG_0D00680 [Kazachstania naganishii CBS 8797]CCK69820.1 hypothetical protein KNAG_0D00680 [Kazachstania naganishii CBS 8797]